MTKRTLTLAILILALTLSACGPRTELEKNRDKWNTMRIGHYRFELMISCFCIFSEVMPVTVEVKNGKIVSMIGLNGQPLHEDFRQYVDEAATIEGLFAVAAKSLSEADKAEVTYDAKYGFPASIVVDWVEMAVDDEISYYVNQFEELP